MRRIRGEGSIRFEASLPTPPSRESIDRNLAELEAGTLDPGAWGHRDHLYVGLAILADAVCAVTARRKTFVA